MIPLQCEEKLKSLLMRVREESKKASLKLNIQKTKIMASGPITSWQIDGESRDITLPTKVCIVKSMVFPVVVYRCESWTTKKAESRRIAAFELWCWRRPLRVPWTARKSNQSTLKEINPEYSLEGLMLKLNSNTLAT